jgi:hypothetical protein
VLRWAYDKLSQAHLELAKRVQYHQQTEQQRERDAKRALTSRLGPPS